MRRAEALAFALALAPFAAKLIVALVWAVGDRAPIHVDGDDALLELYTLAAVRGEQLLGPYSRYEWSHPGPVYFYLLAPFYELTGRHALGLHWGALALNTGCAAGLMVLARRWGGAAFLYATALALSLHVAYFGAAQLSHSWNPLATLLPYGLFVVLAGGVAAGHSRALVLLALVGTFLVQTHIGFLPGVGLVGLAALALGRPRRRAFALAAGVALVLWLPALVEWRNLGAVASFFVGGDEPAVGVAVGLDAVAIYLNGPLAFLAGGFRPIRVPWAPGWSMGALALLQAALLVAAARRGGFARAMALVGLVGLASAALALAQVRGTLYYYLALWVGVLGVLNWATVGAALLRGRVPAGVALALTAALALVGVEQIRRGGLPVPTEASDRVAALYASLRDGTARRPLLRLADAEQFQTAAGLVLVAAKEGRPLAVEAAWAPRFGRAFVPTGAEDGGELLLDAPSAEAARLAAGYRRLAQSGDAVLLARP